MSRFSYSPQFTYQDKPKALFGRVWNKQILSSKLLIQSHDCPLALSKLRHKGDKHLELLQFTSFSIKFIIFAYFLMERMKGRDAFSFFPPYAAPVTRYHQETMPVCNCSETRHMWCGQNLTLPQISIFIPHNTEKSIISKEDKLFAPCLSLCVLTGRLCPLLGEKASV